MIDFIRIQYRDKSDIEPFVCDKAHFNELETSFEYHSGEIKYPYKVSVKNIEVTVNEKSVYVKNSLHKFSNIIHGLENQNYNDFTFSQLCYVVDLLSNKLINLNQAEITQLEFGLNINTSIPAENIIRENILMHNYKGYSHNIKFSGKGEYKQFDHHNYFIKVYDKAKQYRRATNILRFEIKFTKKIEFNSLGIKKIEDLKSRKNLFRLFKYLLSRFDELVIVDNFIENSKIPEQDLNKLTNYTNPNFWLNLSNRKYRNKKAKHKSDFEEMLKKYNLLSSKKSIRSLLIQKFRELLYK